MNETDEHETVSCPCCNADTTHKVTARNDRTIYECVDCGWKQSFAPGLESE